MALVNLESDRKTEEMARNIYLFTVTYLDHASHVPSGNHGAIVIESNANDRILIPGANGIWN